MFNQIINIKDEMRMSSREIAELTNKRHDHVCRDILNLNESYGKMSLPKVGESDYTNDRGKSYRQYLLTKMQTFDLLTGYSAELRITVNRRWEKLETERTEWIGARQKGIAVRNDATDTIQDFIQYAKSQGSKNADKYYTNISTMENKAFFLISEKYPNMRAIMTVQQLRYIQSADIVIKEAIIEGMANNMSYKDIYKLAKERIEVLATLLPKTELPSRELTK